MKIGLEGVVRNVTYLKVGISGVSKAITGGCCGIGGVTRYFLGEPPAPKQKLAITWYSSSDRYLDIDLPDGRLYSVSSTETILVDAGIGDVIEVGTTRGTTWEYSEYHCKFTERDKVSGEILILGDNPTLELST